jgi:colanic acid/amylovoran biosynthesis glycosyltransferase
MTSRIAIYREKYLPASETFIYEQIKHLDKYRPYVLCKQRTDDALKRFPYRHVYRLREMGGQLKRLDKMGIRLIYARFGMGGVKMLPYKKMNRLPLLTSFHGSDVSRQCKKNAYYRRMLPKLFLQGEKFTVVCRYMRKKLVNLGCPKRKIVVLKSGLDLEKFPYQPKTAIDEKKLRILSVGRLTEKKGMDDLIIAFSEVVKKYPDATLVIVGDGEERGSLEKLIGKLGLEKKVDLLGRVEHAQVQEEMEKCDIFSIASRTAADGNEEGIPNVIMEAMATGRVVVSTEHAGIPELIEHKQTGYLVPEKDPEKLGEMLLYALNHQDDWRKIVDQGRQKVEEEHDIKKQIAKLEALIREMLHHHRLKKKRKQ